MSGAKHTPWEVEDLGLPEYLDGIRSRFTVQNKSGAPIAYAFVADEARLIAAAPDLLEALISLVDRDLTYDGPCIVIPAKTHSDAISIVRLARNAIARARGEQDGGGE